jgi:hypothetical protein
MAFLFFNCPTCRSNTIQHLTPEGSYWCQECENIRQVKPAELVTGGMRRNLAPPGNLLARIEKAIKQNEEGNTP